MDRTRVVVIGAGIVGAACARELSLAGFDVLVVDRGRPAGGTTSHGEGNLLVSDKGPGAELRLAQLSARLWPEIAAQLGDACEFDPKGGIVVATTEAGARALTASAPGRAEAGARTETLPTGAPGAADPALPRGVPAAVRSPEDAQVQPAGAPLALLGSALAHGARLR